MNAARNKMQVMFLDNELCHRLHRLFNVTSGKDNLDDAESVTERDEWLACEKEGKANDHPLEWQWDVRCRDGGIVKAFEHHGWPLVYAAGERWIAALYYTVKLYDGRIQKKLSDNYIYSDRCIYFVELIPTLDDEYPRILREVKKRKTPHNNEDDMEKKVVICASYDASVPFDDIRKIFAIDGIKLIMQDQITSPANN